MTSLTSDDEAIDRRGCARVCTYPAVRVVIAPMFIENPEFPIPDDGTDGEKAGAYAAKRCYRSRGKNGRSNLDNQRQAIKQRHGSVTAHVHYGLDISGITRACSLELNRHGLNISQESSRYVDLEKEGRIVLEPYMASLYEEHLHDDLFWEEGDVGWIGLAGYDLDDELLFTDEMEALLVKEHKMEALLVQEHVNSQLADLHEYEREVELLMKLNPNGLDGFDLRKWARGKARNVLSNGIETAGVWSGGIRMWRNVVEQRSNRAAEPEIRRLAMEVFRALQPFAGVYWEDYSAEYVDAIPEFTTPYTKI
jgi:thymidylate synthase ThyX